jgi:hypothetical protein
MFDRMDAIRGDDQLDYPPEPEPQLRDYDR